MTNAILTKRVLDVYLRAWWLSLPDSGTRYFTSLKTWHWIRRGVSSVIARGWDVNGAMHSARDERRAIPLIISPSVVGRARGVVR